MQVSVKTQDRQRVEGWGKDRKLFIAIGPNAESDEAYGVYVTKSQWNALIKQVDLLLDPDTPPEIIVLMGDD